MTRQIGPGTENRAINWSLEEGQIWRRLAFEYGVSVNQAVQELAIRGLRNSEPALAALAEEIERVRKARGMVVKLARNSLCLGFAVLFLICGSDVRRASRPSRTRRTEQAMVFEEGEA